MYTCLRTDPDNPLRPSIAQKKCNIPLCISDVWFCLSHRQKMSTITPILSTSHYSTHLLESNRYKASYRDNAFFCFFDIWESFERVYWAVIYMWQYLYMWLFDVVRNKMFKGISNIKMLLATILATSNTLYC